MEQWNRDFHDVSILFEEKIVRIKADKALKDYLETSSHSCHALASHILKKYEEIFHKPLKIRPHSLAIEIIAHVFADTLLNNLTNLNETLARDLLKPMTNVLKSIRSHTQIIDCGESDIDGNRLVWDALEPFCGIICGIAGLTEKKQVK
ncbi:MAG: BTB domain-containing protein [Lachnoclostridium sp.]|jgi:hypothetical protein